MARRSTSRKGSSSLSRRDFLKSLGLAGGALALGGALPAGVAGLIETGPATLRGHHVVELGPYLRHPALIGFALGHQLAFVPCQDTNNVAAVDMQRYEIAHAIPLTSGNVPWGVAISPGDKYCYVGNSAFDESRGRAPDGPSTVSVIDVASLREVGTIPVGSAPQGLAVDYARRRLFVPNGGSDSLTVVDTDSHDVVATMPVGRYPFSVTLSPSGRLVSVVNFYDASVSLIDAETLEPLSTIKVGRTRLRHPHSEWGAGDSVNLSYSSDSDAWVTNFRSRTVRRVDLVRRRAAEAMRLPKPQYPINIEMLNADVGVVIGEGPTLFTLIDFTHRRMLSQLGFPEGFGSLAINRDGAKVPTTLDPGLVQLGNTQELWVGETKNNVVLVTTIEGGIQ